MEITFYNRPYRIAYLHPVSGDRSIPDFLLKLYFMPSEQCIVVYIPLNDDNSGALPLDSDWKEFLQNFDPDFITCHEEMEEILLKQFRKNFPAFSVTYFTTFEDTVGETLCGKFHTDTGEQEDSLKHAGYSIPVNLLPPVEELSEPLTRENQAAYIYVGGFPPDGKILLPDKIDRKRIIDIIITDATREKQGYRVPTHRLFRKVLSRFNPDLEIRPMRNNLTSGFSIIIPSDSQETDFITLPRPDILLQEVFNEAGYSTHPAKTLNFIRLFGDLTTAGKFLSKPYTVALIERMATPGFKPFNEVRKIISSRGVPDSADTSSEILELLSHRFLLRGYILKCPQCNAEEFYFMKEVDEKFFCKGCRQENVAPLKLPPAYRLNHIVAEGRLNGVVATVLTLYKLFLETEDSFIYCPELGLKSGENEMEIDIVCIVDGEIVIGEAKMGRLIKDRDFSPRDEFEKYKIIARDIGAHRVVFSTIQDSFYEIPMMKIDRFRRELAEEGLQNVEVDIFSGSELLERQ